MINILVMTHGDLAPGMCQATQMITGQQQGLDSLSFRPDWSLDRLVNELRAKLAGFGNDDSTLVMVDMLGGSPSNAIATLIGEGLEVGAVAGANLPMLLEAVMCRDAATDLPAFARRVCETGRESVIDIAEMLIEDQGRPTEDVLQDQRGPTAPSR